MQRLDKIVLVIFSRLFYRFADVCVRRVMHAGVDAALGQDACDERLVADAALVQGHAGCHSGPVTIDQVVKNDNFFTAVFQVFDRDTSDISGTAGN